MPKMSEINVKASNFFKVADLQEACGGVPWAQARLIVEILTAYVDAYKEDGKEDKPAYLLTFVGHGKPFGCNLTNRQAIEGIVGDVEWDTSTLAGLRLEMYAEPTSMGTGCRLRYLAPAVQQPIVPPPPNQTPIAGGNPVHDQEPPPPGDQDDIPFE